jgi:hypothetical protein
MNSHNTNIFPPLSIKVISMGTTLVLEERLKKIFLGIKLIYKEKLFWIHLVKFHKKKGKNGYYLIAINEHYE